MVDLLKYLIIYRDDGIPIYTKCFSNYCSDAFKDPALLTGFLSALENVSQELSEDSPLKSIKVRKITMIFKKTSPSGYSIVLGVKVKKREVHDTIFKSISILLEEKYRDVDWTFRDKGVYKEFEKSIFKNALIPVFHGLDFHIDCPLKEKCPLKILDQPNNEVPVWSILRKNFQLMKERMM